MAFGFSPKHFEKITVNDLTSKELLIIALDTAKKLNWKIGVVSKTGFSAYSKFSMSSWSEEIQIKIEEGAVSIKSECTGNQLMDWGKNKKNVDAFTKKFNELKGVFSSEMIEEKYTELDAEMQSKIGIDHQPLEQKEKTTGLSLFIPSEGYFFTPILIHLNLVVFILMALAGVHLISPNGEDLISWGANFRPVTLNGEWWRLVTSCFLHIGVLHLLLNMYALMYIGLLLEPILGKARFISAYLLTGIAASAASLYWNELTISAGASGAIFGMYGVFLALLTTNIIEKSARKTLLTSIGIFVAYNLMNGLKGDIDNAAHIGGLISGLIIGYVYYISISKPNVLNLKNGTIGAMTVLVLAVTLVVLKTTEIGDAGQYEIEMKKFAHYEQEGIGITRLADDANNEEYLVEIENVGLPAWYECLKIVGRLEKLDVPPILKNNIVKLREYCDLRINWLEAVRSYIVENDESYVEEINKYNKQVEVLLEEMNAQN